MKKTELNNKLIYACDSYLDNGNLENLELAKFLISNGADVNVKSTNKLSTLLHCATRNLELTKFLIDNGADVNAKNSYGETPLMYACSYNNFETTKILIEHGANVNAKNIHGETALMKVTKNWQKVFNIMDIAKILIDKGANVNAKDEEGKTALDIAIKPIQTRLFGKPSDIDIKINEELKSLIIAKGGKQGIEIKPKVKAKAKTKQKSNDFGMGM